MSAAQQFPMSGCEARLKFGSSFTLPVVPGTITVLGGEEQLNPESLNRTNPKAEARNPKENPKQEIATGTCTHHCNDNLRSRQQAVLKSETV
jgi:hypothetical protein